MTSAMGGVSAMGTRDSVNVSFLRQVQVATRWSASTTVTKMDIAITPKIIAWVLDVVHVTPSMGVLRIPVLIAAFPYVRGILHRTRLCLKVST